MRKGYLSRDLKEELTREDIGGLGEGYWDSLNRRKSLVCCRGSRRDIVWVKCSEGMGKMP